MKYLLPQYWTKFEEKKTGKKEGFLFENLIGQILELEYGKDSWAPTNMTRDGGKDFYYYSEGKRLWAECKNYTNKISLNVLSSTLIMAQIYHVDEILVFSYSPLKKPVYEKLFRYTDVSGKIIRIFDDETLESLILHHADSLLPVYFPTFTLEPIYWKPAEPTIICSIVKDPLLAYSVEDETKIIPDSPCNIDFNTILCLYVSIHNKSKDNLKVNVKCTWKNDASYYDFLENQSNIKANEVEPYSTASFKFFFRVINFKKRVELPYAVINYQQDDNKVKQKTFYFKHAICNWLGDTMLIGQSYRNLLDRFFYQSINRKVFSALHIYGTSGTGKSRIINEAIAIGLKSKYRIIKFNLEHYNHRISSNKTVWLIKELVYALYNIPDLDNEIDYDYLDKNKDHSLVFELLKKVNDTNFHIDIEDYFARYIEIIAKKLCDTKCFIIIDNVQYYPEEFIRFMEMIFSYSLIRNQRCLFVSVISFNTSHMSSESSAMSLNLFLKQYSKSYPSIISWHLKGFIERNEARLYFLQLLSRSANIAEKYIEKFLDNMDNNPYYIKSTISGLEKEGVLICGNGEYEITNYSEFYKSINILPENIEKRILHRWGFFKKNKKNETSYLLILSIIHFYGKLDRKKIQQYKIKESFINDLENYEFIKRNEHKRKEFYFHHDIIEEFFTKQYYPLSEIVAKTHILQNLAPETSTIHEKYIVLLSIMDEIYSSNFSIQTFCDIEDIPEKWLSEYLDLLMDFHFEHFNKFKDRKHWIQIATSLCSKIREIEGTTRALFYFDRIYLKCSVENEFYNEISFGWFIITYCNVLYEESRVKDAVIYVKKYWKKRGVWDVNNSEECKVLGYIFNRLHVYKRYNVSIPLLNQEILYLLEQSDKTSLVHNDNEIKYVNLVDYGYCGYSLREYKESVTGNWEKACDLFRTTDIPQKTLNHIQTQIKIALINQRAHEAIDLCNYGLDYVVNGENTYHKGYFSERFNLYMGTAYLMEHDVEKAENAIIDAEEIDSIMTLRVRWIISLLKSIRYYLSHEFSNALKYNEQAYIELSKTSKKTFKHEFLEQIASNYMLIASQCTLEGKKLPPVNTTTFKIYYERIKKYSKAEAEKYIESYNAKGIITSYDKKINFPCI